jgi:glycosyltransferase involved in cell wall biosynthesis
MAAMKILYHHRTVSKDGQDVHIREIIAALARRGHHVAVVAPPPSEGGAVSGLRRALPRQASESLELAYSLADFARLARAWARHRPDVLYERHSLFSLAGTWLKRRTGIPMLLEINAPLCEERATHGGLALARLARWSERTAWRTADVVLPVTRVLAGMVIDAGVPPEQVHVIPNGVDRLRFAAADGAATRRRLGLEGRLVLGFCGFLRPWHGLDRAVAAMAAIGDPALHLLVVGDGPTRADIERQAERLGLAGRVTVLGTVPRDEVPQLVAAFDIALQPCVVEYASPLKLFDYMAAGRAIVAPDQANIREVLRHRHDALLVPPGDPDGLGAAIAMLCRDPDLRRQLGGNAVDTINQGAYTWDANAARIETIARRLLPAEGDMLAALPG